MRSASVAVLHQIDVADCARASWQQSSSRQSFVPEAIVTSGGAMQGAFSAEAAVD
jgi:hypothetical protein